MLYSTDQLKHQLEESVLHLRELFQQGVSIAESFKDEMNAMREQGRLVSVSRRRELNQWCDEFQLYITELEEAESFQEFLPDEEDRLDLKNWIRALTQGIETCNRRKKEEQSERRQILETLDSILDLQTEMDPVPLEELQLHAARLRSQWESDQESRLIFECDEIRVLRDFWQLLLDTRDGDFNAPESLERAMRVNDRYGLIITLQVTRGQIQPKEKWRDNSSVADMVRELHFGNHNQKVNTSNGNGHPHNESQNKEDAAQEDPFELAQLEVLRDQCQARVKWETSTDNQENGSPRVAMCLELTGLIAEFLLHILRQETQDKKAQEEQVRKGMQYLATAQSVLQQIQKKAGVLDDPEQMAAFRWVERNASASNFYIGRHMRIQDPAQISQLPKIKQKIESFFEKIRKPQRIALVLSRIEKEFAVVGHDACEISAAWENVAQEIDHLLEDEHIPPSHKQLRESLIGHIDSIPEHLSESINLQRVLSEIHRYLSNCEYEKIESSPPEYSEEVEVVAQLLRGRKVVMVGGSPRPLTEEKIREAFQLQEFVWKEAVVHSPAIQYQPIVQDPEVTLVLVLIKLVGHGHSEGVRQYCREVDKPYILIPSGYGINHLAHDILKQRGEDLRNL
ncbi:hypothetical protein [Rubinisphaera italica]|uniref:DUF2325 domain-containing protein n=1 Tax=Rubinisphaera italica TaxID=2527969 RepID=A0A5C5XKI7_9PLAN|nr:hypothetical protein [Rubinisphaera italica]TWT63736.1 hypothetical protein Pan54_44940 [Rubinisphaera italica]